MPMTLYQRRPAHMVEAECAGAAGQEQQQEEEAAALPALQLGAEYIRGAGASDQLRAAPEMSTGRVCVE